MLLKLDMKLIIMILSFFTLPNKAFASGIISAPFSDSTILIIFYSLISLGIFIFVLNLFSRSSLNKKLLIILGLINLIIGIKTVFDPTYVVIYNLGIKNIIPLVIGIMNIGYYLIKSIIKKSY